MSNVTAESIAREVGISRQAVSAVLSGHPEKVGAEKRRRILALAEELGYRPNASALSLSGRATKSVGLMLPFNLSPVLSSLVMGLFREIDSRGYFSFVTHYQTKEQEQQALAEMKGRGVDGIISLQTSISHAEAGVPLVIISNGEFDISVDFPYGTMLALKHFCKDHNCCHPALLTDHIAGNMPKYNAYMEFITRNGMEKIVFETRYETPDRLLKLARSGKIDSILCSNDILAGQLINTLTRNHIRIPEEIKISGFGGTLLARTSHCQLSAVIHPSAELAVSGSRLLFEKIAAKELRCLEPPVIIRPRFFCGQSCGCSGSEKFFPELNVRPEGYFFDGSEYEVSEEEKQRCILV